MPDFQLEERRLAATLADLDRIGNRYHGTPGEASCRDYLAERFEQAGLERVRLEPFAFLGYQPNTSSCVIATPTSGELPRRAVQFSADAVAEARPSTSEPARPKISSGSTRSASIWPGRSSSPTRSRPSGSRRSSRAAASRDS